MGRLAIRVRPLDPPRDLGETGSDLVSHESQPSETPHEHSSAALVVDVKAAGEAAREGKYEAAILAVVSVVSFVAAYAVLGAEHYLESAPLWGAAGGCLIHLILGRPAFRLARALRLESKRLRAALTCPYCHDQLDDAAMVCDRDGCGAYYHEECWTECSRDYGGCAIYGCGTSTAHTVGRFALQRRVWRLLVAAALFPPKLVERLRNSERESFREVWQRSRSYQSEISNNVGRTLMVGVANLAVALGIVALCVTTFDMRRVEGAVVVGLLFFVLVPGVILFMRAPLAGHFAWAGSRVIAKVFRDELAALSRADQGTFLARLGAGLGKKD